ncbi:MAG: hypothetical protein GX417_00370 [Clostridiales bacterium]|nr:hypothetical protein [Clostridiales bacterium]
MGSRRITDRDVAYQIAQILVREITRFQKSDDMTLTASVESMVESGSSPLMTYAALAAELNQIFSLEDAKQKFTALNIDQFLGMLLKESVDFSYRIDGITHKGKIRRKLGRDLPITAIVVNAKTHLPGRQFFSYFDLPRKTDEEMRQSACVLLGTLFAYRHWDEYLKRVDKVFGRK